MEHIWAPWRIDYVARPKVEGCVLCAKARASDDVAEQVLYRGQHNYVVLNAYPYNSGHLMVVPYEHVGDIVDVPPGVLAEMAVITQGCIRAMKRCLRPHGVNIGMNIGKAAGAGIDEHIHLHIVPRWEGDTNFMTSCADTRVVPQALEASACALRPLIAAELGEGKAACER
ncbi:MAG: HIT domain-containing protein [Armatimonadetes bacterium]|nr:HIT domain-containing protein [Armatimonadota bacterium]